MRQQHQQLAERLQLLTAQLELLDEPDGAGQEQLQILLLQRDDIAEQKLQQQNLQSSGKGSGVQISNRQTLHGPVPAPHHLARGETPRPGASRLKGRDGALPAALGTKLH